MSLIPTIHPGGWQRSKGRAISVTISACNLSDNLSHQYPTRPTTALTASMIVKAEVIT